MPPQERLLPIGSSVPSLVQHVRQALGVNVCDFGKKYNSSFLSSWLTNVRSFTSVAIFFPFTAVEKSGVLSHKTNLADQDFLATQYFYDINVY